MAQLHMKTGLGCLVVLLSLCASCAPRLPVHEWTSPESALETMNQNSSRVKTLASDCTIQLESSYDQNIVLDGVIYSHQPDELRIAGWKLSDRIFDLLVKDGETWFFSALQEHGYLDEETGLEQIGADGFATMWRYASGRVDTDRVHSIEVVDGDRFEITVDAEANGVTGQTKDGESPRVVYLVEKSTLTVREISFLVSKQLRYRVTLGRYRVIDGIVWPTKLSGRGDQGSFDVRMSGVELNRPLPKTAFKPSSRMKIQTK